MKLAAALLLSVSVSAQAVTAWQLQETRYCGSPVRYADGTIKRSGAVLAAFQKLHPCPSTGLSYGPCKGWAINHVIPLACGGCDSVSNMDWMPDEIKSCVQPWCRDRWERKVYDAVSSIEDTNACTNSIVNWSK